VDDERLGRVSEDAADKRMGDGMADENTRTLVRDLYAAYARGDRERVAALIDDDIDWVIYGPVQVFAFVGARQGKTAVLEALAAIAADYAIERYQPEVIIVDGDRAAVMSNVAFVQRSTGRTLTFRIANFLRFRAGRLVEFREFADTFDVTEQALGRYIMG
jgi:ketosteroid isomerase-like protein